jgi:dTDP-4-dehydrorhamnose reductase
MSRRVFILGHRGMLGHVVARRAAERGYIVVTTDARFGGGARDPVIDAARRSDTDLVLNCLGCTPSRSTDLWTLMVANALFPLHLGAQLRPAQYLIHASTDCVFAGALGQYATDSPRDAVDPYGFSKLLGEEIQRRPNTTVVRTSIVGPNPAAPRGLMAWFLAQPESVDVPGYINHRWNGMTTLDWADFALDLADARLANPSRPVPTVVQPATTVVTKYELLSAIRDIAAPTRRVRPVSAAAAIDRSLLPTDQRDPIREQLERLVEWYPLERTHL